MAGKGDDPGGAADLLEPLADLLLLRSQAFRREDRIGLGVAFCPHALEKRRQLGVPGRAPIAVREMFGRRWVDRLADPRGAIALEETLFREVTHVGFHAFVPSRPRSLRAARNRCTRTVDSFSPVITLTSRGVQSP
jgi:hypothetical protein